MHGGDAKLLKIILEIVRRHLRKKGLPDAVNEDDALASIGINSIDLITLLLEIEDRCALSFSGAKFRTEHFRTIASMHDRLLRFTREQE